MATIFTSSKETESQADTKEEESLKDIMDKLSRQDGMNSAPQYDSKDKKPLQNLEFNTSFEGHGEKVTQKEEKSDDSVLEEINKIYPVEKVGANPQKDSTDENPLRNVVIKTSAHGYNPQNEFTPDESLQEFLGRISHEKNSENTPEDKTIVPDSPTYTPNEIQEPELTKSAKKSKDKAAKKEEKKRAKEEGKDKATKKEKNKKAKEENKESKKAAKKKVEANPVDIIPFGQRFSTLIKDILKAHDMPETKEAFIKFKQKTITVDAEDIVYESPKVLDLPLPEQSEDMLDSYWLIPPHAYAVIHLNNERHVQYDLVESKISEGEYALLEKVIEYLHRTQIFDVVKQKKDINIDRNALVKSLKYFDKTMSNERIDVLVYYLNQNFFGYGKLDPILKDDRIEDITCNGHDIPIYLYHRDYGNIITNCIFEKDELNKFVLKLSQKADKQLSITSPLVDASLPSGARAQLTYSDVVSAKGSSFTIRKFKAEPMTPIDLIRWNTYSSEMMAYIWIAVENRKSLIIAGGTASGKTSTMNAISFFIPAVSKIVSIEDTLEIQLPHGNWLAMKTRETVVNNQTSISMFSLLKAALRQRPEYIIMGEVRGVEAQSLFQAMNSGHTTFSTLHAGSVTEAVNRLTHDPINVPVAMFDALDLIVTQSLMYQDGSGFRRATSLNEVYMEDNQVKYTPLFTWDHTTDTFTKVFKHSRVFDRVCYQNGWSEQELLEEVARKKAVLDELVSRKSVTIGEIADIFDEVTLQTSKYEAVEKDKDV